MLRPNREIQLSIQPTTASREVDVYELEGHNHAVKDLLMSWPHDAIQPASQLTVISVPSAWFRIRRAPVGRNYHDKPEVGRKEKSRDAVAMKQINCCSLVRHQFHMPIILGNQQSFKMHAR